MKKKSESEMSGLFFWKNQGSHASAWFEGESESTGSYWNNDVTVLASVRPDIPPPADGTEPASTLRRPDSNTMEPTRLDRQSSAVS